MAELLLCDCSSLKKLTSYSMWEALLGSSTIYISKVCLTASQIFHQVLSQKIDLPLYGHFMGNKKDMTPLNSILDKFIVKEPSKFIMFGFYLPIHGMPHLQVFCKDNFEK
jgi:hypothetical protein